MQGLQLNWPIHVVAGPEGVRGRNSDNTLIKEVLGWAPSVSLKQGLEYTYSWIQKQVNASTRSLQSPIAQTLTPHLLA